MSRCTGDIVDEIVDITTSSIISYAKAHNGQIPSPHRKVEDEEFIRKFNAARESSESRHYKELLDKHYGKLQEYIFHPELITRKTYEELEPDIRFFLTAFLFRLYVYTKLPQIKELKIFKI